MNHKGWALKKRCFWTVVLEKTTKNPLDCKEIKPVHPKGNQSWIFTGRTDAGDEVPILWPPDVKSRLTGKDTDGGKAEGRRRKWWQRMRWFDASLTQWTRVWANSRRYWSTGKSGVLQSMGLQIGRHWLSNWTIKLGTYLILTARNCFVPKNQNSGRNLILFPAALEG